MNAAAWSSVGLKPGILARFSTSLCFPRLWEAGSKRGKKQLVLCRPPFPSLPHPINAGARGVIYEPQGVIYEPRRSCLAWHKPALGMCSCLWLQPLCSSREENGMRIQLRSPARTGLPLFLHQPLRGCQCCRTRALCS